MAPQDVNCSEMHSKVCGVGGGAGGEPGGAVYLDLCRTCGKSVDRSKREGSDGRKVIEASCR